MTPIRAVGVIFSYPRLLLWSALPIGATIVMLSLVFYGLLAGLWTYISNHFTGFFANYQSGIMVAAGAIAGLMFIYVAIQSLAFLTSLLASPFNDYLAESTERVLGVKDVPGFSFGHLVRVFFLDLRKTLLTLFLSLVMSLLLLIPIVGLVAFLGIALLNTFTFVTYPQSRRHMDVRDSIGWIRTHLYSSLGFGLTSAAMFAIPVINLFALPVMVVGGTLLFLEIDQTENGKGTAFEKTMP